MMLTIAKACDLSQGMRLAHITDIKTNNQLFYSPFILPWRHYFNSIILESRFSLAFKTETIPPLRAATACLRLNSSRD
jgi:hypothetical protein